MDTLLERTGSFGRFQKMMCILLTSSAVLSGLTAFISVFNNAVPEIRCVDKAQSFQTNETFLQDSCKLWANISKSESLNQESQYECHYDTTHYDVTIVTEWGLICDRLHFATLTQTIYMVGSLCSLSVGVFSDRYGRKTTGVLMTVLIGVSLLTCELLQQKWFGFSSHSQYIIYLVAQFTTGFSQFAFEICIFILFMETASSKHGSFITYLFMVTFSLGGLVIVAISYYLRNWHHHNIFIALFSFTNTLLIGVFMSESPRFLISQKRYKEASAVLTRISEVNGEAAISEEDIIAEINSEKDTPEGTKLADDSCSNTSSENKQLEKGEDLSMIVYLTKPLRNLLDVFLVGYIWLASSMCYYGMNYGITSISNQFNPYIMFILSVVAEICGFTIGTLGSKISRRKLLIIYYLLAFVPLLGVAVIPISGQNESILKIVVVMLLAFFGKVLICAAFYLVYHYTSMLFPTHVRNTLISFVSSVGRFGSLSAAQINLLRFLVWGPLPYYIFGLNALLASFVVFLLPNDKKIKHQI